MDPFKRSSNDSSLSFFILNNEEQFFNDAPIDPWSNNRKQKVFTHKSCLSQFAKEMLSEDENHISSQNKPFNNELYIKENLNIGENNCYKTPESNYPPVQNYLNKNDQVNILEKNKNPENEKSSLLHNPSIQKNAYNAIYISKLFNDQAGCRTLQLMIEKDQSFAENQLFSQIIDKLYELSTDPFGNYVIQKLITRLSESKLIQILAIVII